MPSDTTQGQNRGAASLSRAPIERPEIPRGAIDVPGSDHMRVPPVVDLSGRGDEQKATFSVMTTCGHRLTYHDVDVISVRGGVTVFVGPHDVVTWDKV